MILVKWTNFIILTFSCVAGQLSVNVTTKAPGSPCFYHENANIHWQYDHFHGFCYTYPIFLNADWSLGDKMCKMLGGYLPSIHSIEELNFLKAKAQKDGITSPFWIGLRAKGIDSPYEWDDGTPVDFVNWEDGDSGDSRDRIDMCVTLDPSTGYFVRKNCLELHSFMCKVKDKVADATTGTPLPTTTTTTILPQICPDDWPIFGDKCYGVFGLQNQDKETWQNANQKCLEMGATLLSIHSKKEQDLVSIMMKRRGSEMSWTGLHEIPSSDDRAFHWSDGSPVDFTYWDTNQPNNWNNYKEECGNMRFDSPHFGKWNDAECTLRQSYICQIHTDPKKAKFAQDVDVCFQPKGWIKLGSSCYKIFNENGSNTKWLEAQSVCQSFGGNLASVRSLRDTTFLRYHLAELQGLFWIGLRNKRQNERYAWITGPQVYSNWDRGQPYELSEQPNCVVTSPQGRWKVRSCVETYPFICEVTEGNTTIAPLIPQGPRTGMACPNSSQKWMDYGTDFCYIIELQDQAAPFEAAHRCFQAGGFLASFHSLEEVNMVLNQVKNSTNPLHIGLGQTHDGAFAWVDRSPVDFANWETGQPNSKSQMCVEMLLPSGKWNDITCDAKQGYICSVDKIFSNGSTDAVLERGSHRSGGSRIGTGGICGIIFATLLLLIAISAAVYFHLHPSMVTFKRLTESSVNA